MRPVASIVGRNGRMDLIKVTTSCVLLLIGLILGVAVNYYGLLFEAIHVRVQVFTTYALPA